MKCKGICQRTLLCGDFNISSGREEPVCYHYTTSCQVLSKSDNNFFERIEVNTHIQTQRHTDRHIHVDENNASPNNTEFIGQIKIVIATLMFQGLEEIHANVDALEN